MAKSIATQSWLLAGIACLIAAQVLALLAYPQRPSANLDIGLTPTEAEAAASVVVTAIRPAFTP